MQNSTLQTRRSSALLSPQCGASLLEGIAYLGIAAIVVLGAVSLLTGAFSSAQTNRVSEEVISIRTGVKKLYMGESAGYGAGTLLDPTLIAAKVFPSTLTVTPAGVINDSWGGTVTVVGATNKFTITYTLVPQDVCINVVSGASGWDNIAVNGGGPIPATSPVPPATALTACTAAPNAIAWTSL